VAVVSGVLPSRGMPQRVKRRVVRTGLLYARGLLYEFRWTALGLAAALALGGALHWMTPLEALGHRRPDVLTALYGAWMALFAQPVSSPPETWYLALVDGVYPLVGVALIGEGVVRFAMLMLSRRRGEKEWMKVAASTYRDHVVVCGLGHLGSRVFAQLVDQGEAVVAIERDPECRYLAQARATGAPVLVNNMREDSVLVDAGVEHARVIIIATNDDMANLEVAIDARRMNPHIRIAMRQFDQMLASKFREAFAIDYAFSSSALSAPAVAAMALDCAVVSAFDIGGVAHVVAAIPVAARSALVGRTVGDLARDHQAQVLARRAAGAVESPPSQAAAIAAADTLEVLAPVNRIRDLARAARA
jgi:voltage-gated potassium channel